MSQEMTLHIDVRYDAADEIFIAEVLELDGCIAFSRTEADLVGKIKAAISDYFELLEDSEVVEISDPQPLGTPVEASDVVRHSEVRVLAGAC
jgi:predicted RNase H-like HicB family nuclease